MDHLTRTFLLMFFLSRFRKKYRNIHTETHIPTNVKYISFIAWIKCFELIDKMNRTLVVLHMLAKRLSMDSHKMANQLPLQLTLLNTIFNTFIQIMLFFGWFKYFFIKYNLLYDFESISLSKSLISFFVDRVVARSATYANPVEPTVKTCLFAFGSMFGPLLRRSILQGSVSRTWNCISNFTQLLWCKLKYLRELRVS